MSELTVVIKDYRIIKQAQLHLKPGIVMTVAQNCSGKSTLIKAMKTLLDGDYGNSEHVRHGTDGYTIAVKLDDDKIRVSRRGNQTYLKFGDENEVSKLGRGTLSKLEPRFPLKRVDYLESRFYPNFSFQNDVPLFNDISVFDLFSSMFQDVFRVAQRVDSLRKDTFNTSRAVQDLEANVSYQTGEAAKASQAWEKLQLENPNLEELYQKTQEAVQLQQQLSTVDQQLSQFASKRAELESTALLYNRALPYFPIFDRVQQCQSKVEKLAKLKAALSSMANPPKLDALLIQRGYQYKNLLQRQSDITASLSAAPDVKLIELVQSYKTRQEELSRVSLDLASLSAEHEKLFEQIKKEGCPFMQKGVCPKM